MSDHAEQPEATPPTRRPRSGASGLPFPTSPMPEPTSGDAIRAALIAHEDDGGGFNRYRAKVDGR